MSPWTARCPSGAHREEDCETIEECSENGVLQARGLIPVYRGSLLPPMERP